MTRSSAIHRVKRQASELERKAVVLVSTKKGYARWGRRVRQRRRGLPARARVLVVGHDFFILSGLESLLTEAGAEVIVSRTVGDAVVKADAAVSAAILDVALGSETVEPVLARLAERGVPFMFYTG